MTKTEFISWLKKHHACSEALRWASKQRGVKAILATERVDWLEWLVGKLAPLDADYWAKLALLDADYEAKRAPLRVDYEAKRLALLHPLLTVEAVTQAVKGKP